MPPVPSGFITPPCRGSVPRARQRRSCGRFRARGPCRLARASGATARPRAAIRRAAAREILPCTRPDWSIDAMTCDPPASHRSVGDREMAPDHRRAADLAVPADPHAARDARAAGDRRVRADPAVVPDLDLVVELHVVLDHRVVDRAAVDRRVGADLDVGADDDASDLRDLEPAPALLAPCRSRRRRSPRRCGRWSARRSRNAGKRSPARAAVRRRRSLTPSPIAHCAPIRARSPIVAPAPITASAPTDADAAIRAPSPTTAVAWTPGAVDAVRMQDRRDLRVGRVRIGGDELGQRRLRGSLGRHDDGGGAGLRELRAVFRIGEEGDRAGSAPLRAWRRAYDASTRAVALERRVRCAPASSDRSMLSAAAATAATCRRAP